MSVFVLQDPLRLEVIKRKFGYWLILVEFLAYLLLKKLNNIKFKKDIMI